MRGAPVIQAICIAMILGLLGFAGVHFIQSGVYGGGDHSAHHESDIVERVKNGQIPVEIECYFSDQPESYSFLTPETKKSNEGKLILTFQGSEENPVFHDMALRGEVDNVIWLDVTWAEEKPHGNYFVQLVISVGDEEPITRTYRSHTNKVQCTIELDLDHFTTSESDAN